ncbi:hypothetical protein MMC15_005736 [Xylographa vitiligo]|nr:hypothetical protein [Xylographa vitiligo]
MSVQLPVPAGHFGGGKVTHGGLPGKVTTQHVLPGQSVTQTDTGILIAKNASATVTEVPVSLDDADDLVITPGGARHSSLVHHIPPGTTLDVTDMRLRHIGADGKLIADFGVLNRRRGEEPLMPNNVNRVGRAAPIEMPATKGVLVKPAFGSGWITNAGWSNNTGTPISSLSTSWRVPKGPIARTQPNGGRQIIFLFNGIQNSTMIYQPVLAWGSNGSNTGEFWTAGTWYADGQNGPTFHSDFVPVSEGQLLTGVITMTGQSDSQFSYNCQFDGIPNTALPISNVEQLTWACQTLECYGITGAMSYPPIYCTRMFNISITTGSTNPSINWSTGTGVADCGAHTQVVSNSSQAGEVDLCYGTVAAPSLSAVAWSSNRLDVFGLGTNDGLYHVAWDGAEWNPTQGNFDYLGGVFLSTPVAISTGPGLLNVFGLGTDSVCYNKLFDGVNWKPSQTDYESLGGVFNSPVTAVSRAPGKIDLFGLGTDSVCYHKYWNGQAWGPSVQGWDNIGGVFSSQVVVVSWGENRLDIFGISATDNSCLHKGWDGTNWSNWESLGGIFNSPVAAISWGSGRIDLFGLGTNNGLYHKWYDANGGWGPSITDWEYQGGVCSSPPTAVSCGQGRLDVFVLGTDEGMYHKSWNGSSWVPSLTEFTPLGGTFNSNPAAVSWGPGRIDVFGVGQGNNLYTTSSNGFGPLSTEWQDLGGIFDSV